MKSLSIGPFELESGSVIPDVTIKYACFGELNAKGDNVVLAPHGYSSGPGMITGGTSASSEGSWIHLVGPGRAIDTERYFVICPNMLGSSFGTTGPSSIDPATGKPWGPTFPRITLRDIVGVQHRLLRQLGVTYLQAVVGPSYGGMQAVQWALDHGDMVKAIGLIVSGFKSPDGVTADSTLQKLAACPDWNDGWHYGRPGMTTFMGGLRRNTLRVYGLERYLEDHVLSAVEREKLLQDNCEAWASVFDPHSLVVLAGAAEVFDVRKRLGDIKARILFAVSSTDVLFPPNEEAPRLLDSLSVETRYTVLQSKYGHMASGLDWKKMEPEIAWLLR